MNADLEIGQDGEFYIRRKASKREIENYHRVQTMLLMNNLEKQHSIRTSHNNKNDDDHDHDHDADNKYFSSRSRNNRLKLTYSHPPFFITFISIFELVAFLYYGLRSTEPLTLIGPVPFQSKLIYNPHRRYEVWRFLTYMFIHAGYWHISFNLIIQLAVGVPLELAHKFEPVFIIYMGGIVGGALGNSLADPHTYLAGASGGCYALIAAHLSNLIINWSEIKGACCRLFTLLVFSAWDLGTAIYERHFRLGYVPGRTSYGGHLAGALSGLLLGLVVLRNVRVLDWELKVKKWATGIYIILIVSFTFYC